MHPLDPLAYGLRHDRIVSFIKAGKDLQSANTIPYGKDPSYNPYWGNQREAVSLTDAAASKIVELADESSATRIGYLLV